MNDTLNYIVDRVGRVLSHHVVLLPEHGQPLVIEVDDWYEALWSEDKLEPMYNENLVVALVTSGSQWLDPSEPESLLEEISLTMSEIYGFSVTQSLLVTGDDERGLYQDDRSEWSLYAGSLR